MHYYENYVGTLHKMAWEYTWKGGLHFPDALSTCHDAFLYADSKWDESKRKNNGFNGYLVQACRYALSHMIRKKVKRERPSEMTVYLNALDQPQRFTEAYTEAEILHELSPDAAKILAYFLSNEGKMPCAKSAGRVRGALCRWAVGNGIGYCRYWAAMREIRKKLIERVRENAILC